MEDAQEKYSLIKEMLIAFIIGGSLGLFVLVIAEVVAQFLKKCTVNWVAERDRWECPCHGSIFNQEGKVIKGPARNPLPWYDVGLTPDGRLVVNEHRIVPFTETLSVKI